MDATERGAFCHSCQKEVIDFSAMTDREVIEYLEKHKAGCGRFREDQLNTKLVIPKVENGIFRWRALFLGLLPILAFKAARASSNNPIKVEECLPKFSDQKDTNAKPLIDTIHIRGKVLDERGEGFISANVCYTDSSGNNIGIGVSTDYDGNFSLNVIRSESTTNSSHKLKIYYVGYKSQTISITNDHEQNYVVSLKESENRLTGDVVIVKYKPKTIGGKIRYWFHHTFRIKPKH
jgi:hypothetical protein